MPREIEPRDLFADCAVVWTRNKVCTRPRWQHTQPRPRDAHDSVWTTKLRQGFEPALTLRTSGLIGFEADGNENAERLDKALDIARVEPWVVEGRQADDGRRVHVYVRAPLDFDPTKVSFRFEAGTIIRGVQQLFPLRVSARAVPAAVPVACERRR